MKNLLVVTGGAGFVGSNLINALLTETNLDIISIDNYSSGSKKNHINNKRIKYLKANTSEISKVLKNKERKIKTIFHFGEFSRIYQSFKNFNKFESNSIGTQSIEICLFNNIKLVYSATSATLEIRETIKIYLHMLINQKI